MEWIPWACFAFMNNPGYRRSRAGIFWARSLLLHPHGLGRRGWEIRAVRFWDTAGADHSTTLWSWSLLPVAMAAAWSHPLGTCGIRDFGWTRNCQWTDRQRPTLDPLALLDMSLRRGVRLGAEGGLESSLRPEFEWFHIRNIDVNGDSLLNKIHADD